MEKTVVVLSGGMDSATLLHQLLDAGHPVKALSINYGQRHVRELQSAAELCRRCDVEHRVADLSSLRPLLGANSLSDPNVPVPYGHYEEESMKQTVVPNRNMILLSVAVGWALAQKYEAVAYGAHGGDHAIYPDCRPAFAEALDRAVGLCDWQPIKLLFPLMHMDKIQIARRGHELGVPFEITWTCYEGGELHCGRCGACSERREAFAEAGVADPTRYA